MNLNDFYIRFAMVFFAGCISFNLNVTADEPNFVDSAVTNVQRKMVKVYGASAGRVEGYATGISVSKDGKI